MNNSLLYKDIFLSTCEYYNIKISSYRVSQKFQKSLFNHILEIVVVLHILFMRISLIIFCVQHKLSLYYGIFQSEFQRNHFGQPLLSTLPLSLSCSFHTLFSSILYSLYERASLQFRLLSLVLVTQIDFILNLIPK